MSIASYVSRIVYCGLMGRQYVVCFVYDGLSDTDRKEKPVCQEKDSINPAGFKLTGYFFVHLRADTEELRKSASKFPGRKKE